MTTRIKPKNLTREDAERLVGEIAAATNRQRAINTEIDSKIIAIRSRYEGELSSLDATIKEKSKLVQAWADENHTEFANRRSIEMSHGVIGFRKGNPKVKCLKGFTFDRVLEKLSDLRLFQWVRTKREVDKDQILSDYAGGNVEPGRLRDIGVSIVQEDSFFIEPTLTETETRHTAEA
jgi:phage host-nuclease inhibitor protein Gam